MNSLGNKSFSRRIRFKLATMKGKQKPINILRGKFDREMKLERSFK